MNIHKKIGPFPVWAWGVAIAGGLVLGIYLRRRAQASARQATADPNAALDALTGPGGAFGIADPNAGLDNNGIISGLLQQNSDMLSLLLAGAGGGGSPPAISDPATYEPQASPLATPTVNVASSSSGAAPAIVAPQASDATYTAPADPNYPLSVQVSPNVIDTGTSTPQGLPIQETTTLAEGAPFMSAAVSSTGGIGGTGYMLLSDKTLQARPGVNVLM